MIVQAMNLQKQRDNWTCYATAFAMALGLDVTELFKLIGHDGTSKLWPEIEDERFNRAGHHVQELIDVAYNLGVMIVRIDGCPAHQHFVSGVTRTPLLWTTDKCEKRIEKYLKYNYGVLSGTVGFNYWHTVAWNGEKVYDPRGKIEDLGNFEFGFDSFYLFKKIYSCT